ncbi:carboxypeptidase-like regulatory domain-containing protein [Labilibaculum sp. K2S]|uniref:carboxypeptidase-like regulatory domain-containing protein n=1 Tax=Labilibaculum sp. K2S TaxID=3056386 RepID=UPI0025A37E8C|nr:carboxypeptidase-like regulatory domain-containing protein [Labilibaculum sp. K2S]MDM8161967.1 carboxypeptidase-like regulatory domain-containing protein [Labilibaculum sp. K2S]
MKKSLETQKEMQRTFRGFISDNQVKLDAVPVVKEITDLQVTKMDRFDVLWELTQTNYSGTTITKRNTKALAANYLNRINLLFYNYCLKSNKLKDLPNLKGSVSFYLSLSDEKFISKLDFTCRFGDNLGDQLAETAVSTEELADLKVLRSSYIDLAPRPREVKSNTKISNQELKDVGAEILNINKTRLDNVMQSLFAGSDPEFYQSYLEATNMMKVGRRKTAVSGSITDKESKLAVLQAHILIPEAGIDHLCTSKKGGFRIDKLNPGTYQIQIKAVTYKTISMELVHRYGETNVLEVEMETENGH